MERVLTTILSSAKLSRPRRARPVPGAFSADMTIAEVLERCRDCVPVFRRFGLNCCACVNSDQDTVAAIARVLEVPVEELLQELNIVARFSPSNTAAVPLTRNAGEETD